MEWEYEVTIENKRYKNCIISSSVIPTEAIAEWRNLFASEFMGKQYYIYILRNYSGTLYIGVTNNLVKRLWEHKHKVVEGFTGKYKIDKLVYYEVFESIETAILREKQLKNWNRKKKVELIAKMNPTFEEIKLESLI